jgi:hypothetical protein
MEGYLYRQTKYSIMNVLNEYKMVGETDLLGRRGVGGGGVRATKK